MAIPKNTLPLLGRAVRSSQSRKSKSSTVQIGDQPLEPSNLLSNLLGPAAWRGGVSMFRVHTTGFLIGLVLLAHILSFGNAHAAEPLRQNIIWLSCEDISPHIGCFGDAHAITPNLDQLG